MRASIICMILFSSFLAFGKKRKVPDFIKKEFTNCYQQGRDASQGLFDTGLYYGLTLHHWSYGYGKGLVTCDTDTYYLLFYKDGTVLHNILSQVGDLTNPCFHEPSRIVSSIQMAYKHPELPYYHFYGGTWGIYEVKHDTIVIQWIHAKPKGSLNDEWFGGEMKYRILDRQTMAMIPNGGKMILNKGHKQAKRQSDKPTDFSPMWFWNGLFQKQKNIPVKKEVENTDRTFPAKLIQQDSIPPSDCWLTHEDWIRCK